MIILYWIGAALLIVVAYAFGAAVKRANYESRIEELTAQRDAAVTMLDYVKREAEEIREIAASDTVSLTSPEEIRSATDSVSGIPGAMNQTSVYGVGEIGLMQEAQTKYTAQMRRLIDSAS